MNEDEPRSHEYLTYLEHRYNDIKQVLEGVLTLFPPEVVEENHLVEVSSPTGLGNVDS